MTLEGKIAKLFRMDEKARRRHSNLWSGYSRFSMVPLIGLASGAGSGLAGGLLLQLLLCFYGYSLTRESFPNRKAPIIGHPKRSLANGSG